MSNSGNTLSKKTIAIIVIIAILLIVAITAVVVFLRDKGQTSAMAENNPQSAAEQENAEQEQQASQPAEQSDTQSTDTEMPTDVASADNAGTTTGTDNAGTTTPSTTGTTTTPSTTGTRNNGGTGAGTTGNAGATTGAATNNDANNIQETEITNTTTVYNEENRKVSEGEVLSWTPQALATVSVASGLNLHAPNIVTEKTSVVLNADDSEATDQTKVDLTQKVKYTIRISNIGNVAGKVEADNTFDTLPEGLDITTAADLKVTLTDVEGNEVETEAPVIDFNKDITVNGNVVTLNKDVTLEAGYKLTIEYSLKVNSDFLKNEDGTLVANKDLVKNVITVNTIPTEDDKEYDAVQPIVNVNKTSAIYRGETFETAEKVEDKTSGVRLGDFIEYTISVENSGNAATTVNIKDTNIEDILAKAEIVTTDKSNITEEQLRNENGFNVEIEAGKAKAFIFVVKITSISGNIENAVTAEDTTPENPDPTVPENPDELDTVNITGTKSVSPQGTVNENDEITYTIKLTNSGNIAADSVIKDTIPVGTTFVDGSIKINKETTSYDKDALANGITVNVPGNNGTVTLSFVVTANVLAEGIESAKISNTAIINDNEPTNPTETTVNKVYTNITATKIWDDNNNTAGKRPTNVTLQVKNGDTIVEQKELSVNDAIEGNTNQWTHTFSVPKYDLSGNEINYTIDEADLGSIFYTKENAIIDQDNRTITNKFVVPDTKNPITVTKVWDDNGNTAGKRPESVTMVLTGNGQTYKQELTVANVDSTDSNKWVYTFSELPKYDAKGDEITYTLSEELNNIYYTSANSTVDQVTMTVTNKFEVPTDTISIPVTKVWDDKGNVASKRPNSVTLVLTGNDSSDTNNPYKHTLTDDDNVDAQDSNKWTYTFTGLPKYNSVNGDEIVYTLSEENLNNKFYTPENTTVSEDNRTITNKFVVPDEKTQVTAKKYWDDNGNANGRRPGSVILTVAGKGQGKDISREQEVTVADASNGDTNTWEYTFTDLPKYDNYGNEIEYTINEKDLNNEFYIKSNVDQNTRTVTNKFQVPGDKVDVKVTKVWDDNGDSAKKRPTSVTLQVKNGDSVVASEAVTGENEWSHTFSVPKYDSNAQEINYTADELNSGSKFYTKTGVVGNMNSGYTITNKFEVPDEKTSITVTKVWDDNNNSAGKRPSSVIMVLTGNGQIYKQALTVENVDSTDSNKWVYTFNDLPKLDENGDEINYVVSEELSNIYYTTTNSKVDQPSKTITNTFKVPGDTISIPVTKIWDDNSNKAQKRPSSVTLVLSGNDGKTYKVTLNSSNADLSNTNKWNYTFTGLPKYNSANGDEIVYTLSEENLNNKFYTAENTVVSQEDKTVTNKFKVPTDTISIPVTKVWDDNKEEHQDITLQLKNGNNVVGSEVVNESSEWKHTFTVPVYDTNGNEITYTVDEANVPEGYISSVEKNNISGEYTVTNKLPSIDIQKDVYSLNEDTNIADNQIAVKANDVIGYKITVTNTSGEDLHDVVVTDETHDVYQIINGVPTTPSKTIAEIEEFKANDEPKVYIVYYKVSDIEAKNPNAIIENKAKVVGYYEDDNNTTCPVEDEDDADNKVVTIKPIYDISINKKANKDKVSYGETITYTITVSNNGNTTLTNVNVTDLMDRNGTSIEGLTNIKVNSVPTEISKDGVITIGTLNAGATATITADYKVTADDISKDKENLITNTVKVTSTKEDGTPIPEDPDDESKVTTTTEKGEAKINVTKTSEVIESNGDTTDGIAENGDIIKYTITATNNGTAPGDVKIEDTVPTGTTLIKEAQGNLALNRLTNLTSEQLDALEKGNFSETLTLEPSGDEKTKTIVFSVKVTNAKPGDTVVNVPTINDNPATEETQKTTDSVEKTINVKSNTVSNCNVVLVLDTSGSMEGNRLASVKTAAKNLIDMLHLPSEEDNIDKGPQISVVRFSSNTKQQQWIPGSGWWNPGHYESIGYDDNASVVGRASTSEEVSALKDNIDDLIAVGGTKMSTGLNLANSEIKRMDDPNDPNDKNIIIFLSDGTIKNTSTSTSEETQHNVDTALNNLKHNGVVNQTIYTIPFGADADRELLKDIASGPEYCLSSSDNLSSLEAVFKQIINDMGEPVEETSENGKVYLDDIDMNKQDNIKITVDGTERADLIQYIKKDAQTGEYYLDLTKFSSDDLEKEIQIDFVVK